MNHRKKLPPHKIKASTIPHEAQLHFGHYWENVRNNNRQPVSIHTESAKNIAKKEFEVVADPGFNLKVKKRRPLWKDMMIFATTTMGVWAFSHVAMNYSAFADVATFKLQTSITQIQEKFQPEPIEKLVKVSGSKTEEIKYTEKNSAKKMFEEMMIYPSDNRIILRRIGRNVPLIGVPNNKNWQELENTIQKGLQDGVVVHPVSRDPDSNGNFFVTGHSSYYAWDEGRYKDVFALLHEVEAGDEAIVYWEGRKYTYILEKSRVVPPTEVSVLEQPDDKSIITLMTCTPIGTNTNRLIWTGKLISVE